MNNELTILGSSSAIPTKTRNTTAQFLLFQNQKILIDCGEACINRLVRYQLPFDQIRYIFISHLHTDHILGLPGLLGSFALRNRENPLTIFSPQGLQEIIEPLVGPTMKQPYELNWQVVDTTVSQIILDEKDYTVSTIPLAHRVPTIGFLFREKEKSPNVRKDAIQKYNLSIDQIKALKNRKNIVDSTGQVMDSQLLLIESSPPKSYAFCSDTMYVESIIDLVKEVDLLYYEATYLHELKDLAKARGHATAFEAASTAKKANVKKLLMGHFSTRYANMSAHELEAQQVFPNSFAVEDGNTYEI